MSLLQEYLTEASKTLEQLSEDPPEELERFVTSVLECWEEGGKVVSFGNGGSAADSLHFTAELVARFDSEAIHQPAISLNTNQSTLTATANDWSYEEVFARQVRAQVTQDDVVLGISTSGNSANVIRGLEEAHDLGAETYGLTGRSDCELDHLPAVSISVPSSRTSHVQEAHIVCLHFVCSLIDKKINGKLDNI
ncbi:MAG: SIS domain-containing protein [bacterium]